MTDGPDRPDAGDGGPERGSSSGQDGHTGNARQRSASGEQPGYGQQQPPAYGYGGLPPGYGPPPALRPGIVPLRPLAVDDMLGGAFRFIRTNPAAVLVPAFVVAVVLAVAQILMQITVSSTARGTADPIEAFTGRLPLIGLIVLVSVAIYPPVLAIIYGTIVPAVVGRRVTIGQAWAAARPHLGRAYAVYLLLALIGVVLVGVAVGLAVLLGSLGGAGIAIGVLLVIAAYVGIVYIGVLMSPSLPITVVEGIGVRAAIERSRALVRGVWWRFFGIQLLGGLVVGVAAVIVFIPIGILAAFISYSSALDIASTGTLPVSYFLILGVGQVIIGTVTIAYISGMFGLLYIDQRIRRERFDLQLAAIAQAGPPS